jgi:phenylalanine-4-hydroxylase
MAVKRPVSQVYSNYTAEDFKVWKTLFERQMKMLRNHVSQQYIDGLKNVAFHADEIPDFAKVNQRLNNLTGWKLTVVPNLTPQKEFFESLCRRRFTATCWLRSMDQLEYIEEPDMFHDVFAHVPLISNRAYCNFFEGISRIALQYDCHPKVVELLGRLYWYTIEFGMIREKGQLKIYGAGIISSSNETENCMSGVPVYRYDVQDIFDNSFHVDRLQEKYFAIESFEQLYQSLPQIARTIQTEMKEARMFKV